MDNPHAIHIRADGAMDRDSKQTGGIGFVIEFPETSGLLPIKESFRRDGQGIHRLEMIAMLEAMDTLLDFLKRNNRAVYQASCIIVHTDRYSVTDAELNNPFRIAAYRRNKWKTHEGKPVKDADLLDKLDKVRRKLAQEVRGRVEIVYRREKKNKEADKLSKVGKRGHVASKRIIRSKNVKVAPRQFDGADVDHATLQSGEVLEIRIYRKVPVGKECELTAEICSRDNQGRKIKIYVSPDLEAEMHRHHHYRVVVDRALTHFVRIKTQIEEID